MTSTTDTLVDRLRTDRSLSPADRTDLLLDATPASLLRDMFAAKLSHFEGRIVMALNLTWPDGEPTGADIGRVIHARSAPRQSHSKYKGNRSEPDVITFLRLLQEKEWVESTERADGAKVWKLAPE